MQTVLVSSSNGKKRSTYWLHEINKQKNWAQFNLEFRLNLTKIRFCLLIFFSPWWVLRTESVCADLERIFFHTYRDSYAKEKKNAGTIHSSVVGNAKRNDGDKTRTVWKTLNYRFLKIIYLGKFDTIDRNKSRWLSLQ